MRVGRGASAEPGGSPLVTSRRDALRLLAAAMLAPATAGAAAARGPLSPPEPPSDDTVEWLHGNEIADPFRPLEDAARADVRAWVAAEDELAREMLKADPLHASVTRFMRATSRYPRSWSTRRAGATYFSVAFDGQREQGWLEARGSLAGVGRRVIDLNEAAPDGSLSLAGWHPDRTGARIAYLTCRHGGDEQMLRVRDVRTGADLPDLIQGCRWTSVVWLADGRSFYYTRPPLPGEPAEWDPTSHLVFHHRLGEPASTDRMVFRVEGARNAFVSIAPSQGASQWQVSARIGTDIRNGLWSGPLADPTRLEQLVPIGLGSFRVVRSVGGSHTAITTWQAPRGRIVRLRQHDPAPESWQTLVPEGPGVIDSAISVAGRLVVRRIEDLGHRLSIHEDDGRKVMEVPVEEGSQISLEIAEAGESELYVDVDSRRHPRRRDRLNVITGSWRTVEPSRAPHDLGDVTVRRVEVAARDGTPIPLTLMHRADFRPDGSARTLLAGYGSYGVPQLPAYSSLAAVWLRLGGVFAVPALRGGGELGTGWHDAGRRAFKQTTMNDFADVSRWLAETGITRADRLGIHGGSSGGRLVLTSILQRPELFGAAVAGVPIADMLRFHRHTFGIAWTQEYGDPDRPEEFGWLHAHSPLHNVRPGTKYPPLLLLTADNDQRVPPCHAWKMGATLRRLSPQTEVWLRTRAGAGHGAGNAHSKWIEYQADVVTFLVSRLGGPVQELPVPGVARSAAASMHEPGAARSSP